MTPSTTTDNDHTTEGDREERATLYPASNDGSMSTNRGAATRTGASARNALSWRPPTPPGSPGREYDDSIISPSTSGSGSGSNNRRKRWRIPSLFGDDDNDCEDNNDHDEKYDGPDESLLLQDESILTTEHGGRSGLDEGLPSSSPRGDIRKNVRASASATSTRTFTQTIQNFIQNSGKAKGSISDDEEESVNTYQMMKSQHGHGSRSRSRRLKLPKFATMTGDQGDSFFYDGIEELEAQHRSESQQQQINERTRLQREIFENDVSSRYSYFNHQSRRGFIERHSLLNADILREEECHNSRSSMDNDDDDLDSNGFNDDDDDDDFDDEYHLDFMNLFTFGCSPSTRERHRHNNNRRKEDHLPAISDIRKSSLSYMSNGRIQMRLPGDNVRLVMDEFLEPGILSVELSSSSPSSTPPPSQITSNQTSMNGENMNSTCISEQQQTPTNSDPTSLELGLNLAQNESCGDFPDQLMSPSDVRDEWNDPQLLIQQQRKPEPNYLLTVDQDLYKRVLTDLSDSQMPCGLYYCCHDSVDGSKHVNIGVAIAILAVVFTCLFVGVYQWPLD